MYKKFKGLISVLCAVCLVVTLINVSVCAVTEKKVTAYTESAVKQGYGAWYYVYIDSTENLAALDLTVHFDSSKIKIVEFYNSANCTLYDSVLNTDNLQFSYIFDGKGVDYQTDLFYFYYEVLNDAELGKTYFDVTIGEAYDSSLENVNVAGTRTSLTVEEKEIENKYCSIYGLDYINSSIEQEFTLNYSFDTTEIASGSVDIAYDSELFEVLEVTKGIILDGKIVDINTSFSGHIYVSFVGTEYSKGYYWPYSFINVKFKTLKNVDENSEITVNVSELCDLDLNIISCNKYVTNVAVTYDESYVADAPKVKLLAEYDKENEKVTANILLDENSFLGAGDFTVSFNAEIFELSSYNKGFEPDFFYINDKEKENGILKFSIISLEDIVSEQTLLCLEFSVKHVCTNQTAEIEINGNMLADSITNPIKLNFVNTSINVIGTNSFEWVVDWPENCGRNGVKHQECLVCGAKQNLNTVIPATGEHTFEWVIDVEAKCGYAGVKHQECSVCNTKQSLNTEIPATGEHVYYNDCDSYCNVCNISRIAPHNFEWVIDYEATCVYNGAKHEECMLCHIWRNYAEIPATGVHFYDNDQDVFCNVCNFEKEHEHIYDNECDYNCNLCYRDREAPHNFVWIVDSESNCGYEGLKHQECTLCHVTRNYTVIPATGEHSFQWIIDRENSCVVDGIMHEECTECNQRRNENTIIPATGQHYYEDDQDVICNVCNTVKEHEHIYDYECDEDCNLCFGYREPQHNFVWITDREANCGYEGYKHQECTVCGIRQNEYTKIPIVGEHVYTNDCDEHCNVCYTFREVEHPFEWVTDSEANCGRNGYKHQECTVCGTRQNQNTVIPATGEHSFQWIMDRVNSCVEDGIMHEECTECNQQRNENTIIPATGQHYYEDDQDVICNVCGMVKEHEHIYDNECDEDCNLCFTYREVQHNFVWITDREANCGRNGYKHQECTVCGTRQNEYTKIPIVGEHVYTNDCAEYCSVCYTFREVEHPFEWVIDKEATCVQDGLKHQKCKNCWRTQNLDTVIPATGEHSYSSNCDEYCNVCNTYRETIGHTFVWVIDREAFHCRDGLKHQECTACGKRQNENTVIPASAEHTPNTWIIEKESTCGSDGLKYQRCRDCWTRINDTVIPATGEHKFDNNGVCTVCGQSGSLMGDVNGDNNVDAADLALLKKVIAKLTPIDDESVKNPNVDGEGTEPDAADLALLKKIIAKLV